MCFKSTNSNEDNSSATLEAPQPFKGLKCGIISFRLGLSDGVSIIANSWIKALEALGFQVITIAGQGPVDRLVKGLEIDAQEPPDKTILANALADLDLVVVENLCSIPLNLPASRMVGQLLTNRPAIMHHHDPPWQRQRFAHLMELPLQDRQWRHVVINELTKTQMKLRGIEAELIYNAFSDNHIGQCEQSDLDAAKLRSDTRSWLAVKNNELVAVHPVRAIQRKNIPLAIRVAEELSATYWLCGPPEEGYEKECSWLISTARVPVIHKLADSVAGLYAASDLVLFPSSWEGFGNPPIEASLAKRPVVIGDYPVAQELISLGFKWFAVHETPQLKKLLAAGFDEAGMPRNPELREILQMNFEIAKREFGIQRCQKQLFSLIQDAKWFGDQIG